MSGVQAFRHDLEVQGPQESAALTLVEWMDARQQSFLGVPGMQHDFIWHVIFLLSLNGNAGQKVTMPCFSIYIGKGSKISNTVAKCV